MIPVTRRPGGAPMAEAAPQPSGAGLAHSLRRLLGHLLGNPCVTSDHLLIAADYCDEAEHELRVADTGHLVPHAVVQAGADELRECGGQLRAIASRYGDAPLPREPGRERLPIEDMPEAAIASLPPATLVHQARTIVGEVLDSLEFPMTVEERLTATWRLRGALLALSVAHDEVEALQRPLMPTDRTTRSALLHLVQTGEGA